MSFDETFKQIKTGFALFFHYVKDLSEQNKIIWLKIQLKSPSSVINTLAFIMLWTLKFLHFININLFLYIITE